MATAKKATTKVAVKKEEERFFYSFRDDVTDAATETNFGSLDSLKKDAAGARDEDADTIYVWKTVKVGVYKINTVFEEVK